MWCDIFEQISRFMRKRQSSTVPLGSFPANCGNLGPAKIMAIIGYYHHPVASLKQLRGSFFLTAAGNKTFYNAVQKKKKKCIKCLEHQLKKPSSRQLDQLCCVRGAVMTNAAPSFKLHFLGMTLFLIFTISGLPLRIWCVPNDVSTPIFHILSTQRAFTARK